MPVRPIRQYPDPVLKKRATPVTDIGGDVMQLVDDMAETMYAAPGIGLAAPQVGAGHRIIVLDLGAADEASGPRLYKLLNPEIVEQDGEITWEEGCLSCPELTVPVPRARRILVRAWTPDEREIEVEAEDLLAVALQHEIDHLEGALLVDRLSRLKRDLYRTRQRKRDRPGRRSGSDRNPLLI